MKKLKSLLVVLLIMVVVLPFNVKAEDELPATDKEPVKIYMFHGDGCAYCAAALEWFDSIEEEYGDYFDLIKYEVWYDTENQELMEKVSNFRDDNATGVPYIIVGDYSYPNGFASDSIADNTTDQTMGEQLIERILEIYKSDNRYDVMVEMNNKPNYNNVVGIVALVIIGGLVAITVITRRQSR